MGTRPAIFKWRQTKPGLILRAVRWYLRYFLSLRDVEELLEERGLDVDQAAALKVATHPLLSPQRHRRTIPVTSKQLKFCCLTFSKIRFNALWMFVAPIAPKIITFTSVAMKKKFHQQYGSFDREKSHRDL